MTYKKNRFFERANNNLKKTIIILLLLSLVVLNAYSTETKNYDEFALCLSENDAVIYGTEWCSHCQAQKKMFGKSFQHVTFIDCDLDIDACIREEVYGYPTWKIKGQEYKGAQPLERLASITGCELK
ncbi:MAG: hypothetical protein KKF89_04825 [Nanoarchaeota archaeon]|nr:hypothetical protein [Nanoarchaeota archaeon]MBU1855018.1 hypothetical protein [Nanoarchaeota archaeon]